MVMVLYNGKKQRAVAMVDVTFMLGFEHTGILLTSKYCVGIVIALRVIMVFVLINNLFILDLLAHPRWSWAGKSCLL